MARRMVYTATATSDQHSRSHDCFCHQIFFIHNLCNSEKGELKTSRNAPPGLPPAIPVSRLTLQWFLWSSISSSCASLRESKVTAQPQPPPACPGQGYSHCPAQGETPAPPTSKETTRSGMKCITKPSGLRPKITNFTLSTSLLYI